MKENFVANLANGLELTDEPFMLQEINRRTTRDGRPFILGTIRDHSGQMAAVYWDVPAEIDAWIRPGAVVEVTGRVNLYKDTLQVAVTGLEEAQQYDMADFLPSSGRDGAEMRQELARNIEQLTEPWQSLTTKLLLEGPWAERYAVAPAARTMHHAYIGGLLEHSLSMAALGRELVEHYDYVNLDLLVAGALLHDLGKALEFSVEDGFQHTEDGRLVGHIIRSIVLVEQAAAELGIPEDDLRQLIHLLASHHGTQEWGSPVVPKTIEAVLLHQLDLLDSRVQGFYDHVRNDSSGDEWTTRRSAMFGTDLRRPSGFDD